MSCSTYRTLSISYNDPVVQPQNGYVIKWRIAGNTSWNTVTGLFGNPLQITNIPTCYNIEGTVQSDCGNGNLGTAVNFAVSATAVGCYNFTLSDNTTYTFTPCNQTQPVTLVVGGTPQTVCAIDNSVSGGAFTRGTSCTTYP